MEGAGGQSIHGDDTVGTYLFTQGLDQLAAFHPRGPHDLRRQGGHRPEGAKRLRHLADQVPGYQSVVVDLGADGVRGDGPVAQPGHQHQPLGRNILQQQGELGGQSLYRAGEDVPLPAGQPLQSESHIAALGLAKGLFPLLVQNVHCGDRQALPFSIPSLHPRQLGGLSGALLPQLSGFQGQVGPAHSHDHPSFTLYLVRMISLRP